MILELVVGIWSSSLALLSDSVHMLGDLLALLTALIATHLARKPATRQLTYGWRRAETVAALINVVFLYGLSFDLAVRAIERIITPDTLDMPLVVLGIGAAGLAVNLFGIFLLSCCGGSHGHTHGGGHGHAHGGRDLNICAALVHLIGDATGSVGVIVAAALTQWVDEPWVVYVDPAASLLISILCVISATPVLKQAARILMHAAPRHVDVEFLTTEIQGMHDVLSVHELHIWQLNTNCTVASLHVMLQHGADYPALALKVRKLLHSTGIHSVSIQPEFVPQRGALVCLDPPVSPINNSSSEGEEEQCLLACPDGCADEKCCPQ